jgi:hypothetical protein
VIATVGSDFFELATALVRPEAGIKSARIVGGSLSRKIDHLG